jgi:hypothetical protein
MPDARSQRAQGLDGGRRERAEADLDLQFSILPLHHRVRTDQAIGRDAPAGEITDGDQVTGHLVETGFAGAPRLRRDGTQQQCQHGTRRRDAKDTIRLPATPHRATLPYEPAPCKA